MLCHWSRLRAGSGKPRSHKASAFFSHAKTRDNAHNFRPLSFFSSSTNSSHETLRNISPLRRSAPKALNAKTSTPRSRMAPHLKSCLDNALEIISELYLA